MRAANADQRPVLIVDDDADVIDFLAAVLRGAGWQVVAAGNGEEALRQASRVHPGVVLLDLKLPGQDGWLVCSKLKLISSLPKIVLITGLTRPDLDRFAHFVHADAVLRKPFTAEQVVQVVQRQAADSRASA